MRPIMITDRRILTTNTADHLAKTTFKPRLLFIFKGGDNARAVYILGHRVYAKGWQQ